MDERTQRIIEVAIELAERDGFDAVRLRDLASKAGVALGTVYKRFSSKDDILAAALEMQVARLRETIIASPIPGDNPQRRLHTFFHVATSALATQPKLAAAIDLDSTGEAEDFAATTNDRANGLRCRFSGNLLGDQSIGYILETFLLLKAIATEEVIDFTNVEFLLALEQRII